MDVGRRCSAQGRGCDFHEVGTGGAWRRVLSQVTNSTHVELHASRCDLAFFYVVLAERGLRYAKRGALSSDESVKARRLFKTRLSRVPR